MSTHKWHPDENYKHLGTNAFISMYPLADGSCNKECVSYCKKEKNT